MRSWHIWVELSDESGKKIGAFVSLGYKYKQNAVRAAKKKYNGTRHKWTVAQSNPFVDK